MTRFSFSIFRRRGGVRRRYLGVAAALLVIVVAHFAITAWIFLGPQRAAVPPAPEQLVTVRLLPRPIAAVPTPTPPSPQLQRPPPSGSHAPLARSVPQRATAAVPPPETERTPSATAPVLALAATQSTRQAAPDTGAPVTGDTTLPQAANGATSNGIGGSADGGGNAATNAPTGDPFALLPSSNLVYDTFYNGTQNQSGTLQWRTNGTQYSLAVAMSFPFIGTFRYRSAGHIDGFGIAPDLYAEDRGRRGTVTSQFDRVATPPRVVFTRKPQPAPLQPGTQDRFSVIFQLASLVRAQPQTYAPGVAREFEVVDSDSVETWRFQLVGSESVLLHDAPVSALHFARLTRHAGDNQRLDIWLAPAFDWLPVRIMQTESNGAQIELIYRSGLGHASPGNGIMNFSGDDHPMGASRP